VNETIARTSDRPSCAGGEPAPTRGGLPAAKRALDLVVAGLTAVIWLPALVGGAAAILVFDGRPVLYVSGRRIGADRSAPVVKFRTMRRGAATIANRGTIRITGVRFLNIPIDSELYTRIGRVIERLALTELPQMWHVIRGEMSLVGNRPLPEDVVEALRVAHPGVDDRFRSACGLAGPVNLVGRDRLSDADRLALEAAYAEAVVAGYRPGLDLAILWHTLLVTLRPRRSMTTAQAQALIARRRGRPRRENRL
jgi:lipopolysaccharide/colanic/teichoic acid biosynthesis glycosyltransferase